MWSFESQKEKTFNKGKGPKKRKGDLQMRGRRQFLHPPLPQYERRLLSRGSSRGSSLFLLQVNPPSFHLTQSTCQKRKCVLLWAIPQSGWESGEKSSGCRETFSNWKHREQLSRAQNPARTCFSSLSMLTQATCYPPLCHHGCNIGGLSLQSHSSPAANMLWSWSYRALNHWAEVSK